MKTLLMAGLLILGGCSARQLYSGEYKVNTVKTFKGKSVVTFEGLNKEFLLPTDTIKKDDMVTLHVMPVFNRK